MAPLSLNRLAPRCLTQCQSQSQHVSAAHRPLRVNHQSQALRAQRLHTARLARPHRQSPLLTHQPCSSRSFRHYPPSRLHGGRFRVDEEDDIERRKRDNTATSQLKSHLDTQDDVGVLPGTAIITSKSDWPRWTTSLTEHEVNQRLSADGKSSKPSWLKRILAKFPRLRMEYELIYIRLWDFGSLLSLKFAEGGWLNFLKVRTSRRQLKDVAAVLHHQMYNAWAEGDLDSLRRVTALKMHQELRSQVLSRSPGVKYSWSLDPRVPVDVEVLTHRAGAMPSVLPGGAQSILRQAVVRVRSKQSLSLGHSGTTQQARVEVKDRSCDELLVLQKKYAGDGGSVGGNYEGSEEDGWQIQGRVNPSTKDEWDGIVDPKDPQEAAKRDLGRSRLTV